MQTKTDVFGLVKFLLFAESVKDGGNLMTKEKEEPKEPIYYDCTLAKFAEQLDIPLWKAMAFGKYFSGQKKVLDFDKVYDVLDATIYRQFEMNNKQMLDDDIRKLAKRLTDPYTDIYKAEE